MPGSFDAILTAADLGRLIGVSERRVREMRDQGVIRDDGKGRYVLGEAVPAYCSHIRPAKAANAHGGSAGSGDLTMERARLTAAQADVAEMKRATLNGELIPVADAEREWSDACRRLRSRMLAVSSRVLARLGHLGRLEANVIDGEIRAALTELGGAGEEAA